MCFILFLKRVCTDPGVQGSLCVGSVSWTHYCWGVMRPAIRDEGLPPETGQETDCPEHTPDTHRDTQSHGLDLYSSSNWPVTLTNNPINLLIKCVPF